MNNDIVKTEERGFPRFFAPAEGRVWLSGVILVRVDDDSFAWTVINESGGETSVEGGSLIGLKAAMTFVRDQTWREVPRDEAEAMIAKARGEAGAQRAADHADRIDPGWQDRALEMLREYLKVRETFLEKRFLGEEFRGWATEIFGLDEPPDARAFGAVFKRASRDGLIESVGFAPANSSNRSPKTLWRARA